MKRVLFDSDVLIDVLARRQPFFMASTQALDRATQPQVQGYVAGHAVTNIAYILRRQVGSIAARGLVDRLLQRLQVASVTDAIIRSAFQSQMTDFEDAVTSEAARVAGVSVIVTRNTSDFMASPVPAVLPAEFLTLPLV